MRHGARTGTVRARSRVIGYDSQEEPAVRSWAVAGKVGRGNLRGTEEACSSRRRLSVVAVWIVDLLPTMCILLPLYAVDWPSDEL